MARVKLRWLVLIVALVALALAGGFLLLQRPGHKVAAEKIRFRLQWFPQAQFAGYIVANALGYYAQRGLDVEVRPAGPDLKPQMAVAAGTDDIAVGVSNQVIAARSNGVPLVIIAQLFQDSANRYVLKKKNAIGSLTDLRGRKVGLWLGGDEAEFVAMLKTVGMTLNDVVVVPEGFSVTPFLHDEYVLSQVTTYNELIQIQDQGYGDDKLQVLSPGSYEAAIVSDMVFTTEQFLKNHRDASRKFLEASLEGWLYCIENPDEAVDIVLKSNPELRREHQTKQLRAVLGLIWSGEARTKGIGYMDAAYYRTAEKVLFGSGQIKNHVDASTVFDASVWNEINSTEKLPRSP